MDKGIAKGDSIKCTISKEKRNIITSRERVISLRKEFKFSQEDIAGKNINRTLISYIENGKVNLSRKTAEKIIKNVNEIFEAKDIDKCLDISDLLVDYNYEVRMIINEYIEILKGLLERNEYVSQDMIDEIEGFLFDKANTYEKAQIYELIGDAVQNNESQKKCQGFTNYSKALELCIAGKHRERLGQLIIKIAKERVHAKEYEEAIKYITMLLNSVENIEDIETEGNIAVYMVYHHRAV